MLLVLEETEGWLKTAMGAETAAIIQNVQWGAQRTVLAAGRTAASWGAPSLCELGDGRVMQSYLGKLGGDGRLGCC